MGIFRKFPDFRKFWAGWSTSGIPMNFVRKNPEKKNIRKKPKNLISGTDKWLKMKTRHRSFQEQNSKYVIDDRYLMVFESSIS